MLIGKPCDIPSSEITPQSVYLNRRRFFGVLSAGVVASSLDPELLVGAERARPPRGGRPGQEDPLTPYEAVTGYNNFYEYGFEKEDPARNAHRLRPRPWTVEVSGHVARPAKYDLDDLLRPYTIEDRVYRLRCVEAWSMVIPWRGFPLAELVRRLEPTSRARFIEFETLYDPDQMPMQRQPVLDWPYNEGLRLDEALNPLAFLATGLYGEDLPNQNGAPLRLVVPWKYGFKSIKSIVAIKFVERQPSTTWMKSAPHEYGFYANVNPTVDHPRWSQATERRIGELRRRETLMFNGYAEQVAHLYDGLDLRRNY